MQQSMALGKGYRTIAMDPPWPERGAGKSKRGADRYYPVMSVPDIIALVAGSEPVAQLAAEAMCWCWVTDNYLWSGAGPLLDALGFRPIRTLAWVKLRDGEGAPHVRLQTGLGQYLRGAHELCVLGVRGSDLRPPTADRMPSVVFAPRGRHSAKPNEAYSVIERVSPSGPRVEMFARAARPGWDVWGNEAPR